jgi:wyosine [tRNA(Phe)-imidazoG37] synthetase (radical SAM superfamily)
VLAFGPVPSRRLGRSLGINNIPPKICTYSCVYCQLGRTVKMQAERRAFYAPRQILQDVQDKVERARKVEETNEDRVSSDRHDPFPVQAH